MFMLLRQTFEKMEGFSFVTPVTGLSRPNTGKEDDNDVINNQIFCALTEFGYKLYTVCSKNYSHTSFHRRKLSFFMYMGPC
jgi:hypothetical protein